jgi:hypothetical protein
VPQNLPRSASEYARTERAEIGAALSALRRIWRRMGADFDTSWLRIESSVLEVLDTAQERLTVAAFEYVPAVLDDLGMSGRAPEYEMAPDALVGTAGDGRPTDTLAYGAVAHAKTAVAAGAPVAVALAQGGQFLTLAAGTALSDTGRSAEKVAGHSRRVAWYVRMLNPPSCGRCVILAGQQTTARQAFLRHPGCDCRNIPATESIAKDLTVNPAEYLDSLDDDALARALGSKANAQAYRDGADSIQLVNAYRRKGYVRTAQDGVKTTVEGSTRRSLAGARMQAAGVRGPRLMPETIYARAANRDEAIRMLRDYGWIR